MQIIEKHDKNKRKADLIPLQGKLWAEWAEADKEVYRNEKIGDEKLDDYTEKQELRKVKSSRKTI